MARSDQTDLTLNWSLTSVAVRVGIVAILAGIVYLWRPLFHPIIYRMFYSVAGVLLIGLPLLVAITLFVLPRFGPDLGQSLSAKATIVGVVLAIGLALSLLIAVPGAMVEERALAQQTMDTSEEFDEFPEVNEDNARVVPRQVADIQTRGSVSYRQYRLGTSDIARMEDGRLAWSYAVEPEGPRNSIFEKQAGIVMTDMTSIDDREIRAIDDAEFEIGEGMILHRGAEWNLIKGDFHAQYRDDAVEFVHDGEPYMYYPKTGHEWHLTPVPHTTPTWEGGALIHTDGTIEHLSPEEAQNHEILENQRLYPLYNTEREMESLGYRNGIINQLPTVGAHEDQVEIARMPSTAGNTQPFVIDLAGEEMSYVTAMEPYGEDTRGLDEVWFADARTGEYQYYGTGSETLTGPERAMGIVRSTDTQTGWGDDFEVIEPIPVTVDDELWWHAKVVPTDHTDISRNVFVNAHTGAAVEIHDDEAIQEFLAGEDPEEVGEVTTEDADGEPDVAYYVVILNEDGEEIDRIAIEPGQDVSIVQEDEDEPETEGNES